MLEISKVIKTFLLNPLLRWLLFVTVMILNFIAYYQDPIRMSENYCFGIPCKWFSYVTGMGTFSLDLLTFIGLWLTIPFTDALPTLWFVPFILLGFAIITQATIDEKTYTRFDEHGNENLEPPPNYLWTKNRRIILYTAILIIDLIIFMQFYLSAGLTNKHEIKTGFHYLIMNRFGGYDKNKIAFLASWLGIGGFFADNIALSFVKGYEACKYNHPLSWNF